MEVNVFNLKELMNRVANGNYNKFARILEIDVSQLYKILKNEGYGAGKKVIGALLIYCRKNKLDFNDYIFFR